MNLFLWGALPYIAFTFLIVGTLVRFFYFERNWTTKSSEFLEKKQLRIANPLFHFGLLCVIGGHVVGVLIPKTWTAAIDIKRVVAVIPVFHLKQTFHHVSGHIF